MARNWTGPRFGTSSTARTVIEVPEPVLDAIFRGDSLVEVCRRLRTFPPVVTRFWLRWRSERSW